MKYSKTQDSVYCALCRFFGPKSEMSKEKTFNHGSSMLELRRDDLQLFLIHYSFFVSVLYCYIYIYIYNKGNIEFKIDSKNDSKNDTKIDSKNDSKLHSKKDPTPLQVLQHAQILYLFQFV